MRMTRLISRGPSAYRAKEIASKASCQLCSAEFSSRSSPSGRTFRKTPLSLSSSRMKSTTCCMVRRSARGLGDLGFRSQPGHFFQQSDGNRVVEVVETGTGSRFFVDNFIDFRQAGELHV